MTEEAMPPYEFTPAHPPLFSKRHHAGDVWSIPPEQLERLVGTDTWTTSHEHHDRGRGFRAPSTLTEHRYTATRKWIWAVEPPVMHYTNNVQESISIVTGYSIRQKETLEKNIGLKFTGGPASWFPLDVSASLKLTQENERTWKEEVTVKRDQTFLEDNTYVNWILRDVLIVQRHTRVRRLDEPGRWLQESSAVATISCSLTHFPDRFVPTSAPQELQLVRQLRVRTGGDPEMLPVYNAICSEIHDGGMGWMGDDRDTEEEAKQDCREHAEEFPGHDCIVLDFK